MAGGCSGFSMKGGDPVVLVHRHHPERSRLFQTDRQTGNGHRRSGVAVALQHRRIIHPVDVISREDQGILGAASLQQIEVLVDRVRGAAVPRFARPHLRRDRRDVLSELGVVDRPAVTQVLLQRMGLVLRQHENAAQSGMKAVAQREIDDAISSAERHRRLGPLGGQRMQARTDAARQDDADRVFLHVGQRGSRPAARPLLQKVNSALIRASRGVRIEFGCSHGPPATKALL